MKRKSFRIALAAALISAATPMIAHEECPFSGFYGGAQLGGTFLSGRDSLSVSGSAVVGPPVEVSFGNNDFSDRSSRKNSFAGDVFLGYGCGAWDPIYLGAELFLKGNKATITNVDEASATTIDVGVRIVGVPTFQNIATQVRSRLRPWEFGIDARPGVLLCEDTLLYGRIGVAFNRLSVRTITSNSANVTTPLDGVVTVPVNTILLEKHKNIGALRLGLGLEKEICENLSLRTDYIYTRYRKVTNSGSNGPVASTIATLGGPIAGTSTVSSTTVNRLLGHSVMLGLSYYW